MHRAIILNLLLVFMVFIIFPTTAYADDVPATGVRLNHSSVILKRGETLQLVATVYPGNATNKTVYWTSSDNEILEIRPVDGATVNVLSLKAGTASITVTTADKGWVATCIIEVYVPVTKVYLNSLDLTLEPGQAFQFMGTVVPNDATEQRLFWESSDDAIVLVDQTGMAIAKKSGTARVVVKSVESENIYSFVTVTVATAQEAVTAEPEEVTAQQENPTPYVEEVETTKSIDSSLVVIAIVIILLLALIVILIIKRR
ncbi:MAG: Ig-like domain-containing protein [Dethiobacteria bacterium]|nr:Ig-like domain-containing protein [Dethiobacteria bacterium]